MSATESILKDIKSKLNAMRDQRLALQGDYAAMGNHLQKMKAELVSKDQKIQALETEIKGLRMARSIGGQGESNRETKLKINEMVKEIDRCIAMLNK